MQTVAAAKKPNPRAAAEWLATMYATDAIQLAGLRRKIGPAGDLQAAYRRSYEAHMREHDAALIAMLKSPPPAGEESGDAL
jgi:hypothetical protein